MDNINLRQLVKDLMYKHDCIGSWWSYEDHIPAEEKISFCEENGLSLNEFDNMAEDISQELYGQNKPRPLSNSTSDRARFIKDWG